jgi:tetratricopeptide (TPR) repeat protein
MQRKIICFLLFFMLSALPVHSENAMDYFNLGLNSNLTPTKIKYFSKALELDPMLAEAYAKRGMLYFFQEKFDHVIQDFQAYIRLAPPKAEAYRILGLSYINTGLCESAIISFNNAIKLDSEFAAAYAGRAEAYRRCGMHEEAIRDSTNAINLRTDPMIMGDAYLTRAKVYKNIGHTELFIADISSAWKLDPRLITPYGKGAPNYNLKSIGKAGLIGLIAVVFVLIFGLRLKLPDKKE